MGVPLKVNINNLPEDRFVFQFEKKADDFPVLRELSREGACRFKGRIRGNLQGNRIAAIFYVKGALDFQVQLTCSRCLTRFETRLHPAFELTYTREQGFPEETPGEKEIEVSAEEAGMVLFAGDEIDFAEAIQEQAVMALPFRPLCRRTCKGLCPRCGADLNDGDCGCRRKPLNGPLAALGKWKPKDRLCRSVCLQRSCIGCIGKSNA